MSIAFIDLKAQFNQVEDEVRQGINAVLDHGKYIMGPEIGKLEKNLAEFSQASHAVSCSSGTDALSMALMALEVGPGDAVFTTPFTFMATAEAISLLGATPVFVDIDPVSFNIAPGDLQRKVRNITESHPDLTPKGVITVDLFGHPADYDHIESLAQDNGLFLIVDAAQAFGATYKGRPVCTIGDMACTSFFPAKPLGCFGDGGMIFTNDPTYNELLTSIRVHGKGTDKYDNVRIGVNARLDSIQAAVVLAKFTIFPNELKLRQEVADRYKELLTDIDGLTTPTLADECTSAWAQYSVLARDTEHRTKLMTKLSDQGIPSVIYYPRPLHLQTAYKNLGYKPGDFPICEGIAERIFSLPMHPYLTAEEQEIIAGVLAK